MDTQSVFVAQLWPGVLGRQRRPLAVPSSPLRDSGMSPPFRTCPGQNTIESRDYLMAGIKGKLKYKLK